MASSDSLWRCRPVLFRAPGLLAKLFLLSSLPLSGALHHMKSPPIHYVSQRDEFRPLSVTNQCKEVIYPAIATQSGTAPSVQGFRLGTGETRNLTVSADWQGRVWGRTNCSFNTAGTGPRNPGGNDGSGRACGTGDCNGIINCRVTVSFAASGMICKDLLC